MTGRRLTPQNKPPFRSSRFQSPSNLNLTVQESGNSATKFHRSASKLLKSSSHLNLTSIGNSQPNILPNLTNFGAAFVDYEAESDITYSGYLQSLMKQQISKEAIQKHDADIISQLSIQKDNLFKGKRKCQKVQQEIAQFEKLKGIEELLNTLSMNAEQFSQMAGMYNLYSVLEKLLNLLNSCTTCVGVKNVKVIQEKEDFVTLKVIIQKCLSALERMDLDARHPKEVGSLGNVVQKYQGVLQTVAQKDKSLQNNQKNEVLTLLKSISDIYIDREKY